MDASKIDTKPSRRGNYIKIEFYFQLSSFD